jgi:hypothetical protein
MPEITQEWIDRLRTKAENTWVAETTTGVIIIAHPGQQPPEGEKERRQLFGLSPEDAVIRLIDSKACPPFELLQKKMELQRRPIDEQIAYHRQEIARLLAEKGAVPPPELASSALDSESVATDTGTPGKSIPAKPQAAGTKG